MNATDTIQHSATHCNTLQTLQHTARHTRHCNTHYTPHCDTLQHTSDTATHCNTHNTSHCNTHNTTHCNTLQHTSDTAAYILHALSTLTVLIDMHESWHTHEWVMAPTWMSHGTHINESWHTHKWVMAPTWMSHGTHMNESWHTHKWVTSNTLDPAFYIARALSHTYDCITLHRTATLCITLQHTATHCNTHQTRPRTFCVLSHRRVSSMPATLR